MKLNRLETHDRYEHFTKQDFDISACCDDIVKKRPFGMHPFYIFAHARTEDDGIKVRLIWQPRLTKPKAETNSMLFKAYPGTDMIKIIWMIPRKEMWSQYEKGKIAANSLVAESIAAYKTKRAELEAPEADDLSDVEIDKIYQEISQANQKNKGEQWKFIS